MQPYSVLRQKPHLPPKPITWHSKPSIQVQSPPIIQPKTKFIKEGELPHQSQRGIRGSAVSIPNFEALATNHIIDANRQPTKGFKVGDNSFRKNRGSGLKDAYQPSEQKLPTLERNSLEPQPEKEEQEQFIREYEINNGEGKREDCPVDTKVSYSRQIANLYAHDIIPEKRVQNRRNDAHLIDINVEVGQQRIEERARITLSRQLGAFLTEKKYTFELPMTEQEREILQQQQPQHQYPFFNYQNVLRQLESMHPSLIQEKAQGSLSMSGSRTRRHRIFANSPQNIKHHDVQSEYINGSQADRKSREASPQNYRIEQSQVQTYSQHIRQQDPIQHQDGAYKSNNMQRSSQLLTDRKMSNEIVVERVQEHNGSPIKYHRKFSGQLHTNHHQLT